MWVTEIDMCKWLISGYNDYYLTISFKNDKLLKVQINLLFLNDYPVFSLWQSFCDPFINLVLGF